MNVESGGAKHGRCAAGGADVILAIATRMGKVALI